LLAKTANYILANIVEQKQHNQTKFATQHQSQWRFAKIADLTNPRTTTTKCGAEIVSRKTTLSKLFANTQTIPTGWAAYSIIYWVARDMKNKI